MVYGRYNIYNYSIHEVYKPTYNWGAPSCNLVYIYIILSIFFCVSIYFVIFREGIVLQKDIRVKSCRRFLKSFIVRSSLGKKGPLEHLFEGFMLEHFLVGGSKHFPFFLCLKWQSPCDERSFRIFSGRLTPANGHQIFINVFVIFFSASFYSHEPQFL